MAEKVTATQFDTKEYDVTNYCELVCACGMMSNLTLEPEEAVLKKANICSTTTKRMPYGELGSVDKNTSCGCCTAVASNLTAGGEDGNKGISPKCGCDESTVADIVAELKARMKARGDTGNIQRAEQQIEMLVKLQTDVDEIKAKLDSIVAAVKATPSPPPSPPAMARA